MFFFTRYADEFAELFDFKDESTLWETIQESGTVTASNFPKYIQLGDHHEIRFA